MKTRFKITFFILLLLTVIFIPVYNSLGNEKTFSDIEKDFWAKEDIDWAINRGIVVGFGDGTFRPNQQVTEQQFMTMLHRYLELNKSAEEGSAEEGSTEEVSTEEGSTEEVSTEEGSTEEGSTEEGSTEEGSTEEGSTEEVSTEEISTEGEISEGQISEGASIYKDLRDLGIMAAGTNYKSVRNSVINQGEASTIILSALDTDHFMTSEQRIIYFLGELGLNDGKEINIFEPLTRIHAVKLIRTLHDNGGVISSEVEVDKKLGDFELHYFGDWNKRLFYYYPDSGLIVQVSEVKANVDKELDYYERIRGERPSVSSDKDTYMLSISSIYGKGLDYYGYAVFVKDNNGVRELDTIEDFIGLRGNSQVVSIVEGNNISDIKLLLGDNVIQVHLHNLKTFPGDRFLSDRGYGLDWNLFYKGEALSETIDQVHEHLFINSDISKEEVIESKDSNSNSSNKEDDLDSVDSGDE